jgi:hypothetical protein
MCVVAFAESHSHIPDLDPVLGTDQIALQPSMSEGVEHAVSPVLVAPVDKVGTDVARGTALRQAMGQDSA